MPVIPEPSNFPRVSKNEGNESQNKSQGEQQKPSAADFQSKGPQIPDGRCPTASCTTNISANPHRSEMPPKASKEEIEERKKELNKPRAENPSDN